MKRFENTLITNKPFEEVISTLSKRIEENGFRILHIHDISVMLTEKGFPHPPLKIFEICNAKYAHQVLEKDVKISLMLPCPISVYVQENKTHISALLPTSMVEFFPHAEIQEIALEVESVILKIIQESL